MDLLFPEFRRALQAILAIVLATTGLHAAPYGPEGMAIEWTQPDGTRLSLRVFGDEFYASTETLDGYTVVYNAARKAYEYAKLSPNGKDLVSSGVKASGKVPAGLARKLKLSGESRSVIWKERYEKLAPNERTNWAKRVKAARERNGLDAAQPAPQNDPGDGGGSQSAPASFAPVTGAYVGLTILVQFPDDPATTPAVDPTNFPTTKVAMESYCNQIGYTGGGNTGSVRDYFLAQSLNQTDYTQVVTEIVTLPQPRNYYNWLNYPTNTTLRDGGLTGRLVLNDAITILKAQGFNFAGITRDGSNRVVATNVLFAGATSGVWPDGLWPHRWSLSPQVNVGTTQNPIYIYDYQITNAASASVPIGTFCHENGHLLLKYPDLYDYGGESEGCGNHCLMAAGNHLNGGKTPGPINGYFKDVSGWSNVVDITTSQFFTDALPTTNNEGYRIRKPGATTEYFLIENRGTGDPWAQYSPDKGILIWHVDENVSGNDNEQMTASQHYEVSVEQADGTFDLEFNRDRGDSTDLFDSTYPNFTDTTLPDAKWWSGSNSGIQLAVLSAAGASMDVRLGPAANSVYVAYPNGGESIYLGSTQNINWSANITGNVKIDLYKGGVLHSVLSANEPNDGTYSWVVSAGLPAGNDYTVRISSVDTPAYLDSSNVNFTIMPQPTIADALDTTGLTWNTSGNANWFAQVTTTKDGIDAAESGNITHSQSSSMETTLTGPGTMTFWWKVSSEGGYDYLRFYINNVEQTGDLVRIAGEAGWVQKTVAIPAGSQTVKWSYTKDSSVDTGSDSAWVDQVVYTPSTAPEIAVEQPVGTGLTDGASGIDCGTVNLGSSSPPVTFTVRNTGTANLTGLSLSKDGTHNADFALGTLGATTLAPGDSTTFDVTFSPGAAGGRTAAIHLASNDANENPFDIALTGTGVPLGTLSVTAGDFSASGNYGGPFTPSSKVYTLNNTGSTPINWTAAKTAAWVTLDSTSGSLAAGANTTVTVSFDANALAVGGYSDTVSFTNTTNGNGDTTRSVGLTVNAAPATFNFSNLLQTYDGTPKTATITTNPPGLAYSVTYAGFPTAPTNAGSYAIAATITESNYSGSGSSSLSISKASQTISFAALDPVLDNVPSVALTATATSGLSVSYTSSNPLVATISGSTFNIGGLGTSTITASQAGDTNYNAAAAVPQTLTVVRSNPLAVLTGAPYKVLIGQALSLNGGASQPSYLETITTHEWDLNNDDNFGDATGSTPPAISFATLTGTWGMVQGLNTIKLKVTDSSNKISIVSTTVELVLSLTWDANGTTAGQTNGAGAWLGTNLWWDGAANQTWSAGSNATFGGPNTAGGAVTLASPTSVNSLTFNTFTGTYTLGTAAQALTINGGITKNSSSAVATIISPLVLAGAQTWTNDSTSNLNVQAATSLNGVLTIGGTGITSFDNANAIISGAGGIIKNGTGHLVLSGGATPAHIFTGDITVNGGSIGFQTSAFLTGRNANLANGYLGGRFGSGFTWTGGLGTGGNQIRITGGTSGFSGEGSSGSQFQIGGILSTLVWGAFGEGSATGFFNPSVFLVNGDARMNANGKGSLNNAIDLNGANRTFTSLQTTDGAGTSGFTINGAVINSTGTAGIVKNGVGNLILSAANTYNGPTTINGGTLQIGNNTAGSLGNGTYNNSVFINSGSALRIFSTATQTLGGVVSGGGGLVKAYAGTLTLSNSNTYSGKTSLTPQTAAGAGTLIVSSFNSVSGGTASSSLGAPTTVPNGTIDFGNTGIQGGATLRYTGSGEITDRVINFLFNGTGATKILDASGTGLLKFTSAFTGSGSTTNDIILTGTSNGEISGGLPFTFRNLSKSANNTWTLGGSVGNTGTTTVSAGRLALGANSVLSNTAAVSIANAILDAATFTDTAGTLDVTSTSTINLGSGAALAFGDSSTIDWTGGTLNLTGTFVPGASLRFGNSGTGLTSVQLAKITAAGFGPFFLDANGYLTVDITPPTLAGNNIVDDNGAGPVLTNTLVTYTVAFSEDMNAATVSAADFGNAGTAAVTIGTVTETTPGVFSVPVTPTSAGSLQVQVNAGAVLTDVIGNALITTSAIADDTIITVTPPNTAPVANSQSVGTAEDTALPVILTATDGESNPLNYSVISGPVNGTLSGSAPNLTYTPATNYNGPDSFTFKANDGLLDSAPATVDITVSPVNDAPVATAQNVSTAEDIALPITLAGADVENSALSFTIVTPPTNGTLSGTAPNVIYTPSANTSGADSFTFTVNDGTVDSAPASVSLTVTATNDAPVATARSVNTAEDSALSITLAGTDAENSTLSFTVVTPPANGTLSGTAPDLTYTPSANSNGTDSFTFTVNDGTVDSEPATVSITVTPVNDTPVAAAQDLTTAEDTPLPITLAGSDVENSALTYTIVTPPANGTLSGTAPNLTYTPSANYSGPDGFTFTVNDGTIDSSPATVTLTVTQVNDVPVATAQSLTTAEDTALPITLAGTDVENSILTYTIVIPPANGTLSGTAPDLTYTPSANSNGTDGFTFMVNDGLLDSVEAAVEITVTPVNDTPVAAAQSAATAEDTALPITLSGSDVENSALTYTIVTAPTNGTLSGTAPDVIYTPAANFSGPDSFTFTVNDGSLDSAPATVTLTVASHNDAPVATAQSVTTAEDTALPITLTGTDAENSTLTYAIDAQPLSGTLSGTAPDVTYTPAANYSGPDGFTFKVNDGTFDSATVTVSITVTSVNDAPVFTDNPIIAAGGTESLAYTGQTIAGSATDADAGDTLTYSKVSGPAWLSVATNGTLSGTPGSGTAGINSFIVSATDSTSATADATLQITVTGLPLPWTSGDIGTGMLAGSTTFNAGTFTQAGSGVIASTNDKLRFTYQTITGDGEIIARISSLQNTGTSSRVGVMIRDSLASNSKQVFMGMTGSGSYRWVRRTATGGSTSSANSSSGTVPNTWVRLVRRGTTITAYKSANGTSWTTAGSTTGTTFASTCYIGLAVGSGSDTTLNTSQFGNVSVIP